MHFDSVKLLPNLQRGSFNRKKDIFMTYYVKLDTNGWVTGTPVTSHI
nr:MAG TPA: hypothetical protein [Caudoviricetes sp.]